MQISIRPADWYNVLNQLKEELEPEQFEIAAAILWRNASTDMS